jgi:hypothetical protein
MITGPKLGTVGIGDAAADRQTETGAPGLGRHEGIEDLLHKIVGDARPGVRNLDEQVISPCFTRISNPHSKLPTLAHSFHGI